MRLLVEDNQNPAVSVCGTLPVFEWSLTEVRRWLFVILGENNNKVTWYERYVSGRV